MKKSITTRQKQLLQIIYEYIRNNGYPPTFENMRESLGVSSNQSVIDHLENLEKSGYLQRGQGGARNIALLPLGYKVLGHPFLTPFLGVTSAGSPIEAIEIEGEWQTASPEVAQLQDEVFLLKISGDSMINAGIDDGDLVLVKSEKEFVSGNIVLAYRDGEATIKRFISEDKPPYVYLKPENPAYQNILFTDAVRLKGKVISVFKMGNWKSVR